MRFIDHRIGRFCCAALVCLQFALAQSVAAQNGRGDLENLRKRGFDYIKSGEWESANATFEDALALAPKDPLSLYGSALALFNLKRATDAEGRLELLFSTVSSTINTNQLLADALVLSAIISAVQNNNLLAIEKLERAIKLVPAHFDANLSLGRAWFESGEIDKSVAAFRRAVELQPDHLKARFFLATALERKGDSAAALKEYREILRRDPGHAEGNLGIGALLLKTEGDNSAEGISALLKSVARNDRLYEAHVLLGKTFVRLNRSAEAVDHLKKAAALAPNNPEPHFQLAIAYRKLGKKAEADVETEIVKKIHEGRRSVAKQTPQ